MSRTSDASFIAVSAIEKLLRDILRSEDRSDFDDISLASLERQSSLAGLINSKRQLVGVSTNTMKKVADLHLSGGFIQLDGMRKDARDLIKLHRATGVEGRDTKASLRGRAGELKLELEIRQEDMMHLTSALRIAMDFMKEFAQASNDQAVQARLPQALKSVRERASLSSGWLSLVKK